MSLPFSVLKRPDCKIEVSLGQNSKETYVDIREYFMPEVSDEWIPTKRGVRLNSIQFKEFLDKLELNADLLSAFAGE